jgi:hypothetical protein
MADESVPRGFLGRRRNWPRFGVKRSLWRLGGSHLSATERWRKRECFQRD